MSPPKNFGTYKFRPQSNFSFLPWRVRCNDEQVQPFSLFLPLERGTSKHRTYMHECKLDGQQVKRNILFSFIAHVHLLWIPVLTYIQKHDTDIEQNESHNWSKTWEGYIDILKRKKKLKEDLIWFIFLYNLNQFVYPSIYPIYCFNPLIYSLNRDSGSSSPISVKYFGVISLTNPSGTLTFPSNLHLISGKSLTKFSKYVSQTNSELDLLF